MPCHSVPPSYDFAGQNLNFSGQLSDDRLLIAANDDLYPIDKKMESKYIHHSVSSGIPRPFLRLEGFPYKIS